MKKIITGFSLVELMVVIAIAAILTTISIYHSTVGLKANRNAAEQLMYQDAQFMERYYSENGSYLSLSNESPVLPYLQSPPSSTVQYIITFYTIGANSYTLRALPQGGQNQAGMIVCLDSDGNLKESATITCS